MEEEVIAEVQGEEEEINSVDIHEMPILPPSGDSFLFETTSPRLDITSYIIAPPPPPPLDFFNITYESIAATIPWEDLYQSEARTSYKDSVLVEFPKDNIAIETFPKFHKNDYSAKPAVFIFIFTTCKIEFNCSKNSPSTKISSILMLKFAFGAFQQIGNSLDFNTFSTNERRQNTQYLIFLIAIISLISQRDQNQEEKKVCSRIFI